MENNCFGIIYKVTNLVNGKIYIGQTVQDFDKRMNSHLSNSKCNKYITKYFHKAIRKYGRDNFIWEIIEYCNSKKELNEMEFHYIKQYNSFLPNGYNMTLGGEGSLGRLWSKSMRLKVSESKKGKPLSEDHKKLLSDIRKGKKKSKEHVIKVAESNSKIWEIEYPDGKVELIKNLSKFCRNNNISDRGMWMVANGYRKQHKGFKCRKLTE